MLTHRSDGVPVPWLGSSCTSPRPPAAVVASDSHQETKLHLNKIRGLDGDQALQMCSEDITICPQKPAMSSDSSHTATQIYAKILDFSFLSNRISSFCSDAGEGKSTMQKCELGCGTGSHFLGGQFMGLGNE